MQAEHDQYCGCDSCMSIILIAPYAIVRKGPLGFAVYDDNNDIVFTTPNQIEAESYAMEIK